MSELKRGDIRGIDWCKCPVCDHEQWLTRCNYCHADIPYSLIKLQAENKLLRKALRQIITHQSFINAELSAFAADLTELTELADQTGASIADGVQAFYDAREALNRTRIVE